MASDKTCEKLITREVLCFPASKLNALDSSLDTQSFRVSRIEDRVAKFEFRGTVNLHLHGTVIQPLIHKIKVSLTICAKIEYP